MLLRREVLSLLVKTFHNVEGFEVLLDGPQKVGAPLAYADAVAVPENMVYHSHHAVFTWEVGCAVELCKEEQDCMILLVRCRIPGP